MVLTSNTVSFLTNCLTILPRNLCKWVWTIKIRATKIGITFTKMQQPLQQHKKSKFNTTQQNQTHTSSNRRIPNISKRYNKYTPHLLILNLIQEIINMTFASKLFYLYNYFHQKTFKYKGTSMQRGHQDYNKLQQVDTPPLSHTIKNTKSN